MKFDWSGVDYIGLDLTWIYWTGLEYIGLDWIILEWTWL